MMYILLGSRAFRAVPVFFGLGCRRLELECLPPPKKEPEAAKVRPES